MTDSTGVRQNPAARPSAEEVSRTVHGVLAAEPDVACAYLFGSLAKGRARAASDVDVAVLFQEDDGTGDQAPLRRAERALELEARLEEALGRAVQVVALNDAPPDLTQNVLGHGRLVVRQDDGARVRHYVEHARRYYDMAPARAVFDRYRARRIEEGTFGGRGRDRP